MIITSKKFFLSQQWNLRGPCNSLTCIKLSANTTLRRAVPLCTSLGFFMLCFLWRWWARNRWRDRVQGWWGCKMCNVYSLAFFIVFLCGRSEGAAQNKRVATRTRASRASFTDQSALIGSTSCQGYADFPCLSVSISTPDSPPVLSLSVNFYSLFAVYLLPLPLAFFFPVCNAEWWWIDMCRRT